MARRVEQQQGMSQGLKADVVAYFTETTVHGFRYVVQGRNMAERTVWVVLILLGFGYSGVTVYHAYNYWESHPVETTIDQVGVPVQELPFPAITVCDTPSLTMPRKNRWMFLEKLLNSLQLINPKEEIKHMYPGKYM